MFFDGNARLIVPPSGDVASTSWTLEAWVLPSAVQDSVVISRYVDYPNSGQDGLNYEVGLSSVATAGHVRVYARYMEPGKPEVRLDGLGSTDVADPAADESPEIPVGVWTHVAAVFDSTTFMLELYVNGERVVYRADGD